MLSCNQKFEWFVWAQSSKAKSLLAEDPPGPYAPFPCSVPKARGCFADCFNSMAPGGASRRSCSVMRFAYLQSFVFGSVPCSAIQPTARKESIFDMATVCMDMPSCSGLKLPACGHVSRASASFGMGCMPEA